MKATFGISFVTAIKCKEPASYDFTSKLVKTNWSTERQASISDLSWRGVAHWWSTVETWKLEAIEVPEDTAHLDADLNSLSNS